MNKESDPDFAKGMERAKGLEATYGNLGRHTIASGLKVSDADTFVKAVERLNISSLPAIALVPRNLETSPDIDHLVYERESKDLQALAKQVGITLAPLAGNEVATIHENDATVILAGLYIAYETIGKLNGFATLVEFFSNVSKFFGSRRTSDGSEVELSQEVIVREKSTTIRVSYKGPAPSLPEIVKLIQSEFEKNDET